MNKIYYFLLIFFGVLLLFAFTTKDDASPKVLSTSVESLDEEYSCRYSNVKTTSNGGTPGQEINNQTFNVEEITAQTFYKVTLKDCIFKGKTLKNVSFEEANLVNCSFENITLENVLFKGANLEGVSFSESVLKDICFSNSTIDAVDFEDATFETTDFQYADIQAVFSDLKVNGNISQRVNFSYATVDVFGEYGLPIDDLELEDWAKLDFSYTRFIGFNKNNFSTKGRKMPYAKLDGINFSSFDLTNVDLSNASLRDAKFSNNLTSINLTKADLYSSEFSNVTGISAVFESAKLYSVRFLGNCNFDKASFKSAKLSGSVFNEVIATNADFDNAQFSGFRNEKGKDYKEAVVVNSDFTGSSFLNAQINAIDFTKSIFARATFGDGGKGALSRTNFTDANLEEAKFNDITLEAANFHRANLTNAEFHGTTFNTSNPEQKRNNFTCAQLQGVDFSGSTIQNINFINAFCPSFETSVLCCPLKTDKSKLICGKSSGTNSSSIQLHVIPTIQKGDTTVICPDGRFPENGKCAQWVVYQKGTNGQYFSTCSAELNWISSCDTTSSGGKGYGDTITIANPNFLKAIKKNMNIKKGGVRKKLAEKLSHLSCRNAGIETIEASSLGYFKNLRMLDLSENKLTELDISDVMPNLLTLKIENNSLTSLSLNGNTGTLNSLDASNNQIETIGYLDYFQFTYLDLSNNKLKGDLKDYVYGLQKATYIDLSNNNAITGTDTSVTGKLTEVVDLYLYNDNITKIGSIEKLENLKTLDVSGNKNFDCPSLHQDKNPNNPVITCNQ